MFGILALNSCRAHNIRSRRMPDHPRQASPPFLTVAGRAAICWTADAPSAAAMSRLHVFVPLRGRCASPDKGSDKGSATFDSVRNHRMLWSGRQKPLHVVVSGTAYRIRTGDLRLERAVSWASRRMRRRRSGGSHHDGRQRYQTSPPGRPDRLPAAPSEPMGLEEGPDRLGDLLVAALAVDQTVVGVRPERLELRVRATPPAARRRRARCSGRGRRAMTSRGTSATARGSTGIAGDHLASSGPGLVRLLAEQVLDAQDVGEGQVAVVAQQLAPGASPSRSGCGRRPRAPRAAHRAAPVVEARAASAAR